MMLQLEMSTSAAVQRLSLAECLDLVNSGTCERFLRQFSIDYVPKANSWWDCAGLVDCDLTEMMKTASHVMVTRNEKLQICAISFSELMLLQTKLKSGTVQMQVQFFGTSLKDMTDHAQAHLSHSVAATRGRDVDFVLNFPTSIAQDTASEEITESVVCGLKKQAVFVNYLVCMYK